MKLLQTRNVYPLAILLAAMLSGCAEKAEDRQIAEGLACLDSARSSDDADVCLTKVEGLETAKAYLIRCSANFIAQGFTGQRVATAFQQLKDNPGASNTPTASMMAYMVFAKTLPNHTADLTLTNCTRSGVESMIGLASAVKAANIAAGWLTGGVLEGTNLDPASPTFNPAQLQTSLQNLATNADAATQTQIGDLAKSMQSSLCGTGSGLATQDVCTKLNAAITAGGGNSQTIGSQLLDLLTP